MSDARRDQWGRYLVLPPGATKPVGYSRATTIAKTLDDGGGLIPWKATATMVGALRRPGLHARWQALMGEHPDPWYATGDSKTACKQLVEECSTAGGSTDRADLGTALHAIIEQSNKGAGGTPILQPTMQADIYAYQATMAAAGIIVDPTMCETMVVLDEYRVAGTADNLSLYVPGYGHCVGDLKTGANLDYSRQPIAVQLAIYAHGDAIYAQGAAKDGSEDTRTTMPPISQEWGLVIHLPAGEARCELLMVDLVAGWEAFQLSMETRAWRQARNLFIPFVATAPFVPAEPPPFDEIPARGDVMTLEEVRVIESVRLDAVSVVFETPFTAEPLTPQDQHAQVRSEPDEGGEADLDAFAVLERRYHELTPNYRAWIGSLASDALRNHVPFATKNNKVIRRFELLRALVHLCENDQADDKILRSLLLGVIGEPAEFPAVTPGHLLGSLNVDEAKQLVRLVDVFVMASTSDATHLAATTAA